MTGGAWLCLLAPLGATIAITLCGTRIPRVAAAWIATVSCFVAFGGAIWAFFSLRNQSGHHGEITTAWTLLAGLVAIRARRPVLAGGHGSPAGGVVGPLRPGIT